PLIQKGPSSFGEGPSFSASALVFDLVFRQVGPEGFVEALDETLGIVVDEIVKIGFEVGLKNILAVLGENETEFFVGLHMQDDDLSFVLVLVAQSECQAS